MGCLYLITGPDEKQYIGITLADAESRFRKHRYAARGGAPNYLYRAMRKFGEDRFKIETLVIANDKDYLLDLEVKAIAAYGTRSPNGYNMTGGGEGLVDLLQEVRDANAKKFKSAWADPLRRAARLLVMRTEKYRACQREAVIKRLASEEARAASGMRSKIANNKPETRALIASNSKRMHSDPEFKAKHSAAMKVALNRPEELARKAASMRAVWARRKAAKEQA